MVTSCISFNFVVNEFLHQAFASIGMQPMTRKQVSGKFLDELAAEDQECSQAAIATTDFPAGSSDRWRKESCMMGASLMKFTVMGNTGVKNCLHP
jgi:hypothetical protein